jgi:phage shock protein B
MDPATLSIVMPYVSDIVNQLSSLVFCVVVIALPSWAAVKIYRMRAGQKLRGEDAALLQTAMARLQHVEQRMSALERILDAEIPSWRGTHEPAYAQPAR